MKLIKTIGWIGTVLLIGVYGLNSLGYISSVSLWYPLLNLVAATCLGIRVYADRNYSNLILELFWSGIAIFAILKFVIS